MKDNKTENEIQANLFLLYPTVQMIDDMIKPFKIVAAAYKVAGEHEKVRRLITDMCKVIYDFMMMYVELTDIDKPYTFNEMESLLVNGIEETYNHGDNCDCEFSKAIQTYHRMLVDEDYTFDDVLNAEIINDYNKLIM